MRKRLNTWYGGVAAVLILLGTVYGGLQAVNAWERSALAAEDRAALEAFKAEALKRGWVLPVEGELLPFKRTGGLTAYAFPGPQGSVILYLPTVDDMRWIVVQRQPEPVP